jgi:hypothetical protein
MASTASDAKKKAAVLLSEGVYPSKCKFEGMTLFTCVRQHESVIKHGTAVLSISYLDSFPKFLSTKMCELPYIGRALPVR